MTEKSVPKKKHFSWIGLAFALAAVVLVGYLWYGPDQESKVGPEQRRGEIRERTKKKGDYVSSPREPMRQSGAEKSIPHSHQGGNPDLETKRSDGDDPAWLGFVLYY